MQDHATRAAILAAIAQAGPASHYPATLAALPIPAPARPAQPRNAGQFTPRRAGRALRAVLPAWAAGAFAACLVIPGPFDEIALALAALALVVARFPRAASAWRGGKSHRAADGRP